MTRKVKKYLNPKKKTVGNRTAAAKIGSVGGRAKRKWQWKKTPIKRKG